MIWRLDNDVTTNYICFLLFEYDCVQKTYVRKVAKVRLMTFLQRCQLYLLQDLQNNTKK